MVVPPRAGGRAWWDVTETSVGGDKSTLLPVSWHKLFEFVFVLGSHRGGGREGEREREGEKGGFDAAGRHLFWERFGPSSMVAKGHAGGKFASGGPTNQGGGSGCFVAVSLLS